MLLQQAPSSLHGGHQGSSISRLSASNHQHHTALVSGQEDSSDEDDKLDVGEASDLRPDGVLGGSPGRDSGTMILRVLCVYRQVIFFA